MSRPRKPEECWPCTRSRGRGVRTGVRLSTPEGCELGFYGFGDASVPTGRQLRIAITAGAAVGHGAYIERGRFSVPGRGHPQGTAAHGRPQSSTSRLFRDTPPGLFRAPPPKGRQPGDEKGKHRGSVPPSTRGPPRSSPPRRYLLPSPPV